MSADPKDVATVVASRAVRAGQEKAFERWIDRLQQLAREANGYRCAIRLGQTAGFQHLLFRFDDRTAADAWQALPSYREHLAAADAFSTALHQTAAGDPVRFDLPSDSSASKWKRFVTTWLAVFPILLVVSGLSRLVLKNVPPPVQLLFSSLVLTAMLQWIILPRLQRHTRFWLLKDTSGRLRN